MPSSERRNLTLRLTLANSDSPVPVGVVADRLWVVQAAMYHLGDYLTGSDFRVRGGSTKAVRKKCELVIRQVQLGSFSSVLELPTGGFMAEGEVGLGPAALEKLSELVTAVEAATPIEEAVERAISEPRHRSRVVRDLVNLWPSEREGVTVSLGFSGGEQTSLSSRGRLVLEAIASREREAEESSVKGILGTAHVNPGAQYIRIVGPDGTVRCQVGDELQADVARFLGRPVIAYGEAEFDNAGNIRELNNVDRIDPFAGLSLQRIFSGDDELVLREPVSIAIDFQEQRWVAENRELGVFASNSDYEECLREFQEEVFFAWRQYGAADDAELTPGARELKHALRVLVTGEPE